jgi:hypothetical protein
MPFGFVFSEGDAFALNSGSDDTGKWKVSWTRLENGPCNWQCFELLRKVLRTENYGTFAKVVKDEDRCSRLRISE